MFAPHHFGQIILSDAGVILWALAVGASIYHFGFVNTLRVYLVPYLWYVPYSVMSDVWNSLR